MAVRHLRPGLCGAQPGEGLPTQMRGDTMNGTFDLAVLVKAVHDGDTIFGWVDHGGGLWEHGHEPNGVGLRLYGCNARELSMPGGPEARDNLAALIPVGTYLRFTSMAWDKYTSRPYDVAITLPDGTDLVTTLIAQQWVAAWDGTGTKPVPPWPRTVTP